MDNTHRPRRFSLRPLLLIALGRAALVHADTAWRDYAVYQPTVERAFVCDATAQKLRYNHDSSVAWFGGRWFCLWNANSIPEEGAPGQLNYVSTSSDGLAWSEPRPAFSDPDLCANPVPCPKGTQWQPDLIVVSNRLWCVWSQASKDEHNGCYLSLLESPDGKWTNRLLTWEGKADPVIDGKTYRLFPTQNPVRLSTGRVLAPVTMMGPASATAPSSKSGWYGLEKRNSVLYTDDSGATWRVSPGTVLPGLDWRQWEPTVFEQPDGSVMMFARNNLIPAFENAAAAPAQTLTWALSKDGGATWSPQAFVPLQTVVSRMHVLRQEGCDRYLMIHNDWLTGTFGTDRRNLALFVNRGGGLDFVAGTGLTDTEREVAYPQMALHGDTLLASYSQGPCALRGIKAVRVTPLPDPERLYLYPRANLPAAARCAVAGNALHLGGGRALTCRAAPRVSPDGLSCAAWINPEEDGALFDNRSPAGGFVWGLSGTCFVHLGEPARNIRSTLRVLSGRWNYVGLTLDYARGSVTFHVNGEHERVTFKPGSRTMAGTSATLAGPNPATSSLSAFSGALRSFALYGTNRLTYAEHRRLFEHQTLTTSQAPTLRLAPADADALARDFVMPTAATVAPEAVQNEAIGGQSVLRFTGAASAGIELAANERAHGDAVELELTFQIESGDGQVICTAGDANQPARVRVRGGDLVLCANSQTQTCGRVTAGAWQRLALRTQGNVTRAALDGQPAVEVRHSPEATWLYLGEGYRPAAPVTCDTVFRVDVKSVRSRIDTPRDLP